MMCLFKNIFKSALFAALFVLTACTTVAQKEEPLVVEESVVVWSSAEGVQRLAASQYKVDFFQLANNFQGQPNKIFCGPTSVAIVLNALRVRKSSLELPQDSSLLKEQDLQYLPNRQKWSPLYKRYSPNNVLDKSSKARAIVLGKPVTDPNNKDGKAIKDFGLQLHQLTGLLSAHDLDAQMYVVGDDSDNKALKQLLIDNLQTSADHVIVNYKRSALNQAGGGHISPLGAYHKPSDSFLVLDTAPNKADWVWVKADSLINAMRTFDTVENRGFVLIKEK